MVLRRGDDLEGSEAAYRRGDERGDVGAANNLGFLLEGRGDLEGAEDACRRGDERGDAMAALCFGVLLHQRGREAEADAAYRRAIAGGYSDGWLGVGELLAKQRGREAEAEAAYRKGIDGGATGTALETAEFKLGDLLARRGDVAGARAAYEVAIPLGTERVGVDLTDPWVASGAARGMRFRLAVAQRPWVRRLTQPICGVVGRLASRCTAHGSGHEAAPTELRRLASPPGEHLRRGRGWRRAARPC
ncbi:MAG: tetratricopeptide repeat protein [Actinomycetota bacterium]|nr:tetratricopeptide repeat protein [Actinomycetota bacterium]